MLYDEATEALSNSIGPAKITAKGIETPLGVVTTTQIEKGEGDPHFDCFCSRILLTESCAEILKALYNLFQLGSINQEKEKVHLPPVSALVIANIFQIFSYLGLGALQRFLHRHSSQHWSLEDVYPIVHHPDDGRLCAEGRALAAYARYAQRHDW